MDHVERLLAEAAERGDFDDLPGSGRPMRLDDTEPGWWGRREAHRIRSDDRHDAMAAVEASLGNVWLLPSAEAVGRRVDELNSMLLEAGVDDARLDLAETLTTWRRMARMRIGGSRA